MPSCDAVRASLSAAVDGEPASLDEARVADHVGGCRACATFAAGLPGLARRTRLTAAEPVPDLRAGILTAIARDRAAPTGARRRRDLGQRRAVAALAGVVQLVVAVPTLLGAGAAGHVAHDLAASEAALGVVFLLAAWQPARAAALALVASVFAAIGAIAAVAAVLDGGTPWGEAAHLVPALGAAVLWTIAPRQDASGTAAGAAAGHR